jgi:hypothetical protein
MSEIKEMPGNYGETRVFREQQKSFDEYMAVLEKEIEELKFQQAMKEFD